MQDVQLPLCPRDCNIGKPPFLLHLALAALNRLHTRENAVLHSGQEHDRELQPLRAVNRHHHHRVGALIVAIHVRHKRRFLEEARQGRRFVSVLRILHVLQNLRLEFL